MSSGPAFEVRGPEGWMLDREQQQRGRQRGRPTAAVAGVEAGGDAAELRATVAALVDAVERLERVVATLAHAAAEPHVTPRVTVDPSPLTHRQLEVLRLLADGHSTDAVASELFLSRPTVHNHVARTLRALGAHTRLEAVAIARARGLL